jgi:DNA polymerase I-like protein with 3'-5' exonuclease and polymerase domains
VQYSFFVDEKKWAPPTDYPKLHGTIALDLETRDPGIHTLGPGWATGNGYVVGASIATESSSSYYPWSHDGGGNLPKSHVLNWLFDEFKNPDLEVIVHNRLYDDGWLIREFREANLLNWSSQRCLSDLGCKVYDTGTAAPLIDENRMSYGLDALGFDYCGERKENKELADIAKQLKLDSKTDMWKMHAGHVGSYAEQDATLTRKLWFALRPYLDKEQLWPIFNLETELLPCLLAMRWNGVRVDVDRAGQCILKLQREENTVLDEIKRISGHRPDVWATGSVVKVLDKFSLPYPMTPTGKPSVTAAWLTSCDHVAAKHVLRARRLNKIRTTFLENYVLGHAVNGRLYAQFNPLRSDREDGKTGGAVTGRFSSNDPNLQNLPSGKRATTLEELEEALMVRGCFLPEEGDDWGAVDFSGQEPRLSVHFAAAARVYGVQKFVDAYKADARMDFHAFGAKVTGQPRKLAKDITLGVMYGEGGAKICHTIGLPTKWIEKDGKKKEIAGEEGQAILDGYNKDMPFVKGLSDLCMQRANGRGFIRTLLGRHRRFKTEEYPQGCYAYKSLNCLIQGSASDWMKKAMVDLYKEKIVPLITLHDEVGVSGKGKKFFDRVSEVMCNAVQLLIPAAADVEVGPSWGESMPRKVK